MKFVTGSFKGTYKGKEVDPLNLSTFASLHFLHIDPGATMHNCEWINDYSNQSFSEQLVRVNSIPITDFHFNLHKHPDQLAFRDNMQSGILLNPRVYNISRKDDYTYGTIEGKMLAIIGGSATNIPAKQIIENKTNYQAASLPIKVTDPSPIFIPEKFSTWRWSALLKRLFWIALFGWGLWWLINHRGCNDALKTGNYDLPKLDTTVVRNDNDTLLFYNGNMTFSVYDWSVEDDDTISMFLNGHAIAEHIALTSNTVSWVQPALHKGSNTLLIESINNGTIGPASPTIEINDGRNNQVFQIRVYKGKPKKLNLVIN